MSSEGDDYVVLKDDSRLNLKDFHKKVPIYAYVTNLHINVCEGLSQRIDLNIRQRKIYVNLLINHSQEARNITSLITLINKKKLPVKSVHSKFLNEDIQRLISQKVDFNVIYTDERSLIYKKQVFRFLLKILLHKVYRLFPERKRHFEFGIRSWVEITLKMYPEKFKNSLVLVYPFTINFIRQLRYLRLCKKNKYVVQLTGLPYRLRDAVHIIFNQHDRDILIVKAEERAYLKHGEELGRRITKCIYTSDEFEAGAIALCEKLNEVGINVHNSAHGLGFVCPYVGYQRFKVYNKAQYEYYAYKSPSTEYIIEPRVNTIVEVGNVNADNPVSVVLLHGNFNHADLRYHELYEIETIKRIGQICDQNTINFFVKLHPNATKKQLKIFREICPSANFVKDMSELAGKRPVFINFYSAAFYDFISLGPVIFVSENISSLADVYGHEVESFELHEVEGRILQLLNFEMWKTEKNRQYDLAFNADVDIGNCK